MTECGHKVFENHRSSVVHEKFGDNAITELVQCGSAREESIPEVCVVSPLGLVEGRKLQLILDLCYVSSHLAKCRFKCDGPDCLVDIYETENRPFAQILPRLAVGQGAPQAIIARPGRRPRGSTGD